jgi:hypothetical protein
MNQIMVGGQSIVAKVLVVANGMTYHALIS